RRAQLPKPSDERDTVHVRAVTLSSILRRLGVVDLIDLDVQGAEADVLESAADSLADKAKRVHIGTHSREIEDRCRVLFRALGWECRNDYGLREEADTPYGRIWFSDGVQTWLNPRLG